MTRRRILALVWLLASVSCGKVLALQDPEADEPASKGTIEGVVRDIDGRRVAGASVMLCEGHSGYPMVAGASKTIVEALSEDLSALESQLPDFAVTDEDGNFRFENIRFGTWRLVARLCRSVDSDDSSHKIPGLTERAEEILLLGQAVVELNSEMGVAVELQQAGAGVLKLDEDVSNDDTFLAVSTGKPRGDPVIGVIALGGEFFQQFAGWNYMPGGRTIVRGLPEGDVYFFLMSLDNSPGYGSGHVEISGDGEYRGRAPFVAAWSDAIHDPPPELAGLFARVRELESTSEFRLKSFLGDLGYNMRHPGSDKLYADLEKDIELPDGSKSRLIDLLAVLGYQQLQER